MTRDLWPNLVQTLVCAAMLGRAAACRAEDDFARLKRQAREFALSSGTTSGGSAETLRWAAAIEKDGSWKDVDYADQSRSFWKTSAHLKRTLAMATLYAAEKQAGRSDAQVGELKAAALSAAHYWISHDFRNPNWWQNEIGVPQDMATILLLIKDEISPEDKAAGLRIVGRATLSRTGQNMVWLAGIVFRRALIEGDTVLAGQARAKIMGELKVTREEGLQADMSFQQHGPQQQMGNYGLSFATEMANWARIWQGTAMAMPPEKMALLRGFLLQGEAVVTVNGAMDISGCGRQLFPGSPEAKGRTVLGLLEAMAKVDTDHAREYEAAALRDARPAGSGEGASMNWNFFRSDTMVHRRPGFYASVKLCSRRVIGSEVVNSENLSGRYLADGATYLYQTNREYAGIFPVWDWRRIPGVTCLTTGTTLAPAGTMATDFAGGVSDGSYGAAGLDLRRDGATGRKGWFFFDEEVVCLGAGIAGDGVRTSVDQRLAEGVTLKPSGSLLPGVQALDGASWLLHGTMGYIFEQPAEVWAGTQEQTGSWKQVYAAGSAAPVTRKVFSVWIDDAAATGRYAYTLVPGATAEKLRAYVTSPRLEIVGNTAEVQAVRDGTAGVTEALFYAAATLDASGLSIHADGPCALILKRDGIYAADPTQKEKAVTLTINGRPFPVTLPQGEMAGSSVRVSGVKGL